MIFILNIENTFVKMKKKKKKGSTKICEDKTIQTPT